jgi:L-fucose dehydrogenase
MDLDLKDKVVLITGGGSGIGAAIVRAVVSEGAVAVIADRSAQQANDLQTELQAAGGKIHVVV